MDEKTRAEIAKHLRAIADCLENPTEQKSPKTEESPKISLTDVRALLAEISQLGHTADVKKLLEKYGCKKLSEVKPEDYAKLMKDAEVLKNAAD